MRHISLVGNENYILIRFFVTWKIPLPSLTLQGSFWDALMGRVPLSPGPGWHYLPHKHAWGVTHGLDSHAQGEPAVMRQPQWPVVQGNEMCLNIRVHFGITGGLKDLSAGGEGGHAKSYASVRWKNVPLEGLSYPNCKRNLLTYLAMCDLSSPYITLWFHSSGQRSIICENNVFKCWFSTGQTFWHSGQTVNTCGIKRPLKTQPTSE